VKRLRIKRRHSVDRRIGRAEHQGRARHSNIQELWERDPIMARRCRRIGRAERQGQAGRGQHPGAVGRKSHGQDGMQDDDDDGNDEEEYSLSLPNWPPQ
jgi:hypothetical protein